MWALIENNRVVEITDKDPKGRFHKSLNWVVCDTSTVVGMIYDGESFSIYRAPAPTPEEAAAIAKQSRFEAVAAIKVKTAAGNTFDGDEVAQNRMSRAILVLGDHTIQWKLVDNTFATVDVAELTEALALAGQEQANLWVEYG